MSSSDVNEMPEARRAEFVRAFTNQFGFGVMTASVNSEAANMLKAAAWAWQASRETLEVKLPFLYDGPRQKVVEALEAAGIRVAP